MKNKILIFIFAGLGLILIVAGITLNVYNINNEKEKERKKNKEVIIESHESFREYVEKFNKARATFYEDVFSDMFIENVENYDKWIEGLNTYTVAVDNVVYNSDRLKGACFNLFYSSIDVKYKCDSFIIAYETTVNYYTKDVIEFNDTIKKFNKELENPLEEYKSKYEFTDLDDNGKYYGKD